MHLCVSFFVGNSIRTLLWSFLVWFVKVFTLAQLQKLNGEVLLWKKVYHNFGNALNLLQSFSEYPTISNIMLLMVCRDRKLNRIA